MDEDFEEALQRAIMARVVLVNHLITEVTIGPNSVRKPVSGRSPVAPKPRVKADSENSVKSSPVIEEGVPTRQLLQLFDWERQEDVHNALKERLRRFKQFEVKQEESGKQAWADAQRKLSNNLQKQENTLIEANKQYEMIQASQQAQLAQMREIAAEHLEQKKQQLLHRERQRQALASRVLSIKENQDKYSLVFQQIIESIKTLTATPALKNSLEADINAIKDFHDQFEKIIEKCKGDNVINLNDEDVEVSGKVLENIVALRGKIDTAIEDKQKEEQRNAARIEENKQVVQQPAPSTTAAPAAVAGGIADNVSDIADQINSYISISNLQIYQAVLNFRKVFKEGISDLENNQSHEVKMFRNDCRKTINISVNALSNVNPEHILDKYRKLHSLLRGETVMVGDNAVNASKHPQGISFCMDLLAKKFVMQGDTNVSSNPESAFCYASVILSLWNDFSDFGMLVLAYFYETCPYLVPYYIPQGVDESHESYFSKRGYQYNNGDVEQQDKFIMRMTGIMKLYFALLITKPKRGQDSPYNLKVGWRWLASFLRLKPEIDITATALRVFLETVGFEMDAQYGKQFQKILKIILQIFLPKCKEAKHLGGVLERLEELINNYIKTGKFEKPPTYIDYAFW